MTSLSQSPPTGRLSDQINITGYKKQIQEITGHNATATCTGGLKNHDDNNSINKMQTV